MDTDSPSSDTSQAPQGGSDARPLGLRKRFFFVIVVVPIAAYFMMSISQVLGFAPQIRQWIAFGAIATIVLHSFTEILYVPATANCKVSAAGSIRFHSARLPIVFGVTAVSVLGCSIGFAKAWGPHSILADKALDEGMYRWRNAAFRPLVFAGAQLDLGYTMAVESILSEVNIALPRTFELQEDRSLVSRDPPYRDRVLWITTRPSDETADVRFELRLYEANEESPAAAARIVVSRFVTDEQDERDVIRSVLDNYPELERRAANACRELPAIKWIREPDGTSSSLLYKYAKGLNDVFEGSEDRLRKGIDELRKVLSHDSSFACGKAYLSNALGARVSRAENGGLHLEDDEVGEMLNEAFDAARSALVTCPESDTAWKALGMFYAALGDVMRRRKEAVIPEQFQHPPAMDEAAALGLPELDGKSVELGRRWCQAVAQACYERSIELRPSAFWSANNLIAVYGEMGDAPRALEIYRRARALVPGATAPAVNLAHAFSLRAKAVGERSRDGVGLLESAKVELESSLGMPRASGMVAYNLACVLSQLNEIDSARAALIRALKMGDRDYVGLANKDPDLVNLRSKYSISSIEEDSGKAVEPIGRPEVNDTPRRIAAVQ